jgi:hypothetical protein
VSKVEERKQVAGLPTHGDIVDFDLAHCVISISSGAKGISGADCTDGDIGVVAIQQLASELD